MGTVEQVYYEELTVLLVIDKVEDDDQDDLELPDKYEVPLVELWATIKQENPVLNVDLTADAIDRLRFFYTKIWRPWDIDLDEDTDWTSKNLETRIKFFFDFSTKKISSRLTMHIKNLLDEANYIHERKELLELQIDDDDLDDDKTNVNTLMRLHLRLKILQNEIELLENPDMRNNFELIKFSESQNENGCQSIKRISLGDTLAKAKCNTFIICSEQKLADSVTFLQSVSKTIDKDMKVQISHSLQDTLENYSNINTIYLSPGIHFLRFSEYLLGNAKITGPIGREIHPEDIVNIKEVAILASHDHDSVLLTVDSINGFTFENLYFDCTNVRVGLIAKSGKILLKNCVFRGNPSSTVRQGIIIYGKNYKFRCKFYIPNFKFLLFLENAKVELENCIFLDFATAIFINSKAVLQMTDCNIQNCIIGLDNKLGSLSVLQNTTFEAIKQYGIILETQKIEDQKTIIQAEEMNKLSDIPEIKIKSGVRFVNNHVGNIVIIKATDTFGFDNFDETMDVGISLTSSCSDDSLNFSRASASFILISDNSD